MEAYLNILHFCFYKAHYRLHLVFNHVNPARLLARLPFLKRRYEQLGVNIYEEIDHAFGNKRVGLSVTAAGGALWGMLGVFLFALLLVVERDVDSNCIYACVLFAGVIAYCGVFRHDKYLAYFARYENWSKGERTTYGGVTLASVVATCLLFYWGLTG